LVTYAGSPACSTAFHPTLASSALTSTWVKQSRLSSQVNSGTPSLYWTRASRDPHYSLCRLRYI
jgi:hypothetical protein